MRAMYEKRKNSSGKILHYTFCRLILLNNKAENGRMTMRLTTAMHVNQVNMNVQLSYSFIEKIKQKEFAATKKNIENYFFSIFNHEPETPLSKLWTNLLRRLFQ